MKNFDANNARIEMSILANSLKRAEKTKDYESGHYDDNKARYNELKRQLEKHHERVVDFVNM